MVQERARQPGDRLAPSRQTRIVSDSHAPWQRRRSVIPPHHTPIGSQLSDSREDPRDRQVEAWPFLANVRRREVDQQSDDYTRRIDSFTAASGKPTIVVRSCAASVTSTLQAVGLMPSSTKLWACASMPGPVDQISCVAALGLLRSASILAQRRRHCARVRRECIGSVADTCLRGDACKTSGAGHRIRNKA